MRGAHGRGLDRSLRAPQTGLRRARILATLLLPMPLVLKCEPQVWHDPERVLDTQRDIVCNRVNTRDDRIDYRQGYLRQMNKFLQRQPIGFDAFL